MLNDYLENLLSKGRIFDLGQPIYPGMPHHPNQPPFGYVLLKKHGDITIGDQEISFLNDLFMMGGHTGTHLDAVGHVACNNRVYNDIDISDLQSYQNGLQRFSIEETAPVVRRGVLLDIPELLSLEGYCWISPTCSTWRCCPTISPSARKSCRMPAAASRCRFNRGTLCSFAPDGSATGRIAENTCP